MFPSFGTFGEHWEHLKGTFGTFKRNINRYFGLEMIIDDYT